MGKTRKAFTVIEVTLFLAITGLLMAGIIAGTSASVARQRYNDSVNSFTEFLRNVFSEVANIQNIRTTSAEANARCSIVSSSNNATGHNPGRSECAIYGKLVTFGEADAETIHVYDVVGNVIDKDYVVSQYTTNQENQGLDRVLAALQNIKADVVSHNSAGSVTYASGHYSYTPEWQARIENINPVGADGLGTKFDGAMLIVRSPLSGTIHTFISTTHMSPQSILGTAVTETDSNTLTKNYTNFSSTTMDFCINSDDIYAAGNRRRNVRIAEDGNTTTSVELISVDDGGLYDIAGNLLRAGNLCN